MAVLQHKLVLTLEAMQISTLCKTTNVRKVKLYTGCAVSLDFAHDFHFYLNNNDSDEDFEFTSITGMIMSLFIDL